MPPMQRVHSLSMKETSKRNNKKVVAVEVLELEFFNVYTTNSVNKKLTEKKLHAGPNGA